MRPVRSLLLIAFLCTTLALQAQPPADSLSAATRMRTDSLRIRDSLRLDSLRLDALRADSLAAVAPPIRDTLRPRLQYGFASDSLRYRKRLFFSFTSPVRYTVSEKSWEGKEATFYVLVALVLLFALLKNAFPRYLSDLYSTYFRTTVRQRQLKEQLLQSPLPSLLFNGLFVLSGAVFVGLLAQRFGYGDRHSFPLLVLYAAAGLAVIYGGKFLLLKFFGWVLQLSEAVNDYIFVVFSTNKVLGIFLLPFAVLLAFSNGAVNASAFTLSLVVVAGFFAYRFFLAFLAVSASVRINLFHFVLYLAGFEIIPLLLINKALFIILREMA